MEFEIQLAYYYQFMSDDTCQCKLRQIVVVITSNFDELYFFSTLCSGLLSCPGSLLFSLICNSQSAKKKRRNRICCVRCTITASDTINV